MPKYNKPQIIEAVCEFRFTEDTNWDLTTPGIIYGEIRDEYPHIEQQARQDINSSKDIKIGTRINTSIVAQFLSKDKNRIIQVGPRILSINQLKPYHSWNDFKSQISYAFQKLTGKVEVGGIQRIGLRYINKIEIPMDNDRVKLEKYFDYRPFCGERLPQAHHGFVIGCVFPFADGSDLCKVELRDALSEIKGSMAFLLSLDYFLAMPRSVQVTQSMEWVENAHEKVESLFEGCILPPLRSIFEEDRE